MRVAPVISSMFVAAAVGCGARSALDSGASSSGHGGAGTASSVASTASSASTSASTGAGGGGGAPPMTFCPVLVADPAIFELATAGRHLVRPTLVAVGKPGVTLLHNAFIPPLVELVSTLSFATFQPWGAAWPPNVSSAAMQMKGMNVDARIDLPFAASRHPGDADGTFEVAFVTDEGTTEDNLDFGDTGTSEGEVSSDPVAEGLLWNDRPLSDAKSAFGEILLTETVLSAVPGPNDAVRLDVNVIPLGPYGPAGSGCALGSVSADVVSSGDGWLIAGALGVPFGFDTMVDCQEIPKDARPRRIYTGALDGSGYALTGNKAVASEAEDIALVRLARGPGERAWMAWGVGSGSAPAALRVARLDVQGDLNLGPVDLPPLAGAIVPSSFSLASLGPDAVVGSVEVTADGSNVIAVHHVDATGHELAGATIATGGPVTGAVTIVADPAHGVAVSWSELPAGATEEVLRVARLACNATP